MLLQDFYFICECKSNLYICVVAKGNKFFHDFPPTPADFSFWDICKAQIELMEIYSIKEDWRESTSKATS